MKTVLVMVISCQDPPYTGMACTSNNTWNLDPVEGVEAVFYFGNPVLPSNDRCIYFPVQESYQTMGHKDLLAFEWALKHRSWDFMARVNASCYVHKRRLRDHCQGLPDKNLFRGICAPMAEVPMGRYMWGGGQYIFSRDVIAKFVDHKLSWNHAWMEDVAMSLMAHDLGIPFDHLGMNCSVNKRETDWLCITHNGQAPSFEFTDFAAFKEGAWDQFFFRVKCDLRRHIDAEVMKALKHHLPP